MRNKTLFGPSILVVSFLLILLILFLKNSGFAKDIENQRGKIKKVKIINEFGFKKADFLVELADNDQKTARGLMGRKQLPLDYGMLFIFANEENHLFWMKNTYLSLDIVFADKNGKIIGIIKNAKPMDTAVLSVGKPSKYVLEINNGLVDKYDIKEGDKMLIIN